MKRYREPEARCAECGGYVPVYPAPLGRGGEARYGFCAIHRDAEVVEWPRGVARSYEMLVRQETKGAHPTLEMCSQDLVFPHPNDSPDRPSRTIFRSGDLTTAWLLREKWRQYDQVQTLPPKPSGARGLFG